MRLSKMFICAALPAAGLAATAQAMEQNVYATVGGTLAIGPRTLSINNAAFGNSGSTANGGDALFDRANDGRFKYMGTLGVVYRNFGLEAKYINLGSQHLTGVNGSGLTKDENGYFSGKYYDLNAVAFIPMNEGRQDFYFMIGGGRLKTHFSTTATQGFTGPGEKVASQSEAALLLGGGVRFNLAKWAAIDLPLIRLTLVSHGIFRSGIYNNAYNMFAMGLTAGY